MALCYWEAKRLPGAPPSHGDNHVQNLCAPFVILQTDGWKTSRFLNLSSCDSAFQVKEMGGKALKKKRRRRNHGKMKDGEPRLV